MPTTEIFLVRHGETEWNVQQRLQGHADSPLTEIGHQQADALAESLKSYEFDAIYSSDLKRTTDTADKIVLKNGGCVQEDARIRERHFGVLQGLTTIEMAEKHPHVWQQYQSYAPDYRIPEGESAQECLQRVVECLEELAEKHQGKRILIVTHGGVLSIFLKHVLKIPLNAPRRYQLLNSSLNIFTYDKEWMLYSWGDMCHVNNVRSLDDTTNT